MTAQRLVRIVLAPLLVLIPLSMLALLGWLYHVSRLLWSIR